MSDRVKQHDVFNEMIVEKSMNSFKSLIVFILFCIWATPLHAWMWEVGDEELAEVTGEGFSSFTLTGDVAKAYFNINASTYTEIASLKMGYYDAGWDQDWTSVKLGSESTDLVCKGLYIEAGFTDISSSSARTLNYVKFGTQSMTGPISATFNSFSGHIENPTDGVLVDGRRINLGSKTITSTNSEFSVTIDKNSGWWFSWNNATIH
jgi:hypothetical protein